MTVERGYGPVVILRGKDGWPIVIPHVNEGIQKTERWMNQTDMLPVQDYEFPGGLNENEESIEETAVRELWEEAWLRVKANRLRALPAGGILDQQRGEREMHLGATLYELQLNPLEELWIRLVKRAKSLYSVNYFHVRPRDRGIMDLLDQISLESGEGQL